MFSLKKYRLQITVDLGSYFTRVYLDKKLVLKERTVAFVTEKERQFVYLGNEAFLADQNQEYKDCKLVYPIRDGYIANSISTYEYIKFFLDKLKGRVDIFKPDFFLKTPYNINSIQEHALTKVFTKYGANSITFINSYDFLKKHYSYKTEGTSMVLSLGAGINEAFLIEDNEIIKYEYNNFAGIKFTNELKDFLEEKLKVEFAFNDIEELKLKLADCFVEKDKFHEISSISNNLFQISSKDITPIINNYLNSTVELCEKVKGDLDKKDLSKLSENGVFLTGGSSQLSNIREFLSKVLNLPVY
jgi:rod shape-determining protein MreB